MADSNRCQGQCHVGGSQEFIQFNRAIHSIFALIYLILGTGTRDEFQRKNKYG